MNKQIFAIVCMVSSAVCVADTRKMERSDYDEVQQVKVTSKFKVGSKVSEKDHIIAPGQHIVIVNKESGLVFDGVVEECGKDVKINLHLVNHKTNGIKGDQEATVAWGKPATFTCEGDNKSVAELSMVVTQVS